MTILRPLLGIGLLAFCGLGIWTQTVAHAYGYHPLLGEPLWQTVAFRQTYRLYAPLKGVEWQWRWGSPVVRLVMAGSVVGAILLTAGGLLVHRRIAKQHPPEMTGHGSTEWAPSREVRKAGLYAKTGLVLGKHRGKVLRFNGPENVLLVGPQRQGKGVGVIIPSLLELQEHVVVIDVRGETWDATAGYRRTLSRCLRLSLTQLGSVRFNPLQEIRKGTPYEFMDASLLGDSLITGGHNKPHLDHWEQTGKSLATCGMLYEVHKRLRPTLGNLAHFWSQPGRSLQETLRHVIATAPTPQIADLAQEVLNKSANEASGVLSTMMAQLFLFRDPTLDVNTQTSDFRLSDFVRHDRLTSLYIVLSPGEEEHLRPFLRMFLRFALQRWLEISAQKHRITLILDEFVGMGRLSFFVNNLAVLGGRGIRTLIAVQNVPQLRDVYGHADTISEQCKVRVFFSANGQTTGQEISRQTGMGTATTVQESRRAQGWSWAMDESRTRQAQQHARPLLTDAEAMQIPAGVAVIQAAGCLPIWGHKLQYWKHRVWRQRSQMTVPSSKGV